MDTEAVGKKYDWPLGLRWYCHYERALHPEREKDRDDIEDSWCRRLQALLSMQLELRVEPFKPYPFEGISDLVLHLPSREILWIEVKGAWSYCNDWHARGRIRKDDARKSLYGRPGK